MKIIEALGGEDVTYLPRSGGGRSIKALVTRNRPGGLGTAPYGESSNVEIQVANDSETGIAATEVDRGDNVELIVQLGCEAKIRPVTKILAHDEGEVHLEIR